MIPEMLTVSLYVYSRRIITAGMQLHTRTNYLIHKLWKPHINGHTLKVRQSDKNAYSKCRTNHSLSPKSEGEK